MGQRERPCSRPGAYGIEHAARHPSTTGNTDATGPHASRDCAAAADDSRGGGRSRRRSDSAGSHRRNEDDDAGRPRRRGGHAPRRRAAALARQGPRLVRTHRRDAPAPRHPLGDGLHRCRRGLPPGRPGGRRHDGRDPLVHERHRALLRRRPDPAGRDGIRALSGGPVGGEAARGPPEPRAPRHALHPDLPGGPTDDALRDVLRGAGVAFDRWSLRYGRAAAHRAVRCELRWHSRPAQAAPPPVVEQLAKLPGVEEVGFQHEAG